MKIKVCGMKNPENIQAIKQCTPDFMGFIFYEKSPRFVADELSAELLQFDGNPQKVGVFVNAPLNEVIEAVRKYELDFVQLHGDESSKYVSELSAAMVMIIKVFRIHKNFDWTSMRPYLEYVNYFLFDTATKNYGGSGLKFDWKQLNNYQEDIPFFLSGGIALEDIVTIKNLNIPQLYSIDINSKFETAPGIKEVRLIKEMINQVRNESELSSK